MTDQPPSEALYEIPQFSVKEDGWGPCSLPEQYVGLPFNFFYRDENLGMAIDLLQVSATMGRNRLYFVFCLFYSISNGHL